MRSIHYNISLDEHYTITNCPVCDQDGYADDGSEGDVRQPGIRLTFEQSDGLDQFIDDFDVAEIDGTDPYFRQHWREILRGEDPSWKLARVQIDYNFLWLEFYNEALYDADCTHMEQGDMADDMSYYIAAIAQEWGHGGMTRVKMRFEVGDPDGSGISTTLVKMGGPGTTYVTEFDGNKKRTFEFSCALSPEKNRLIGVTECMQ